MSCDPWNDAWENAMSIIESLEDNVLDNQLQVVAVLRNKGFDEQADHFENMSEYDWKDFLETNLNYSGGDNGFRY